MRLPRLLHLAHRWLGIALGLQILLWFVSGVVMLYLPFPELTAAERLQHRRPIPAASVGVPPWQAWSALGLNGSPDELRLSAAPQRPAYHFLTDGRWQSVWADSGEPRAPLSATEAEAAARAFAAGPVGAATLLTQDQWSVGRSLDPYRPLYRVAVGDAAATELYVSARTGEVVRDTTAVERFWNWPGSIVHWIYFSPLRMHAELWRQVVLWLTAAAGLLVLTGTWLGVQRLRLRRRYPGGRTTPYLGWKRWHHLGGLAAALCTLTWLLSGWLSLAPFGWAKGSAPSRADHLALADGPLQREELATLPGPLIARHADVREALWQRFDGRALLLLHRPDHLLRQPLDGGAAETGPIPVATMLAAARRLRRDDRIHDAERLDEGDRYYYGQHRNLPFPVLRVRFDDATSNVFYLDLATGRIAARLDDDGRRRRWLFNALHRLDFPPLDASRALRYALVIALSALGAALGASGCVLSWRRVRRHRGSAGGTRNTRECANHEPSIRMRMDTRIIAPESIHR
ncbi:PepSY domain-containing protein [Aromatoleum toluclasticum]|uniref:PepSY domain-containing protein n=1 Tax=Aromatoleum toluclasticum TaxID=92003 RepID=UPI00037E5CFD|nr:PepSY domain-containing protein [Aromatoleum toluclasticum]